MIRGRSGFRGAVGDLVTEKNSVASDLCGCRRNVEGRLVPQEVEDVVRIVKAARQHRAKLHAFSCGKNWGFGSALPSDDNVWLLDLSQMRRLSEYDPDCGAVTIEPGVTQGTLYEALRQRGGEWFFNITGAGQSTSVLGNALERGIGYYGQRNLDLIDLQVVTGAGEVTWTRLGRDEAGSSSASIGTDLTQLFCHGSFGIVVAARLRLIRRTDGGGVVIARLRENGQAAMLFDRVLRLIREGCIAGVPHIGNRERIVTTMAPWLNEKQSQTFCDRAPEWTAALPLLGRRELVEASSKVIAETLADLCDMETIIGSAKLDVDKAAPTPVEQLQHLACGFPSGLALPSVQWAALGRAELSIKDPENTKAGLIQVTPAVKSSTTEIVRALGLVCRFAQSQGFPLPAITVNIVDSLTTVLVISLAFARDDAALFQNRARALQDELRQNGIGFYRAGLIQGASSSSTDSAAKQIHANLKKLFDPDSVLAASKYDRIFSNPVPVHLQGISA